MLFKISLPDKSMLCSRPGCRARAEWAMRRMPGRLVELLCRPHAVELYNQCGGDESETDTKETRTDGTGQAGGGRGPDRAG